MPYPSEPRFLVLHALRLKGFAEPPALSAVTRLAVDEVGGHLQRLAGDELVVRREGRLSGWALSPAGREEHAALTKADLDQAGCRDDVNRAYLRFLDVNGRLLEACTSWQLRQQDGRQVPNDHRDPAYDAAVVDRLHGVDDEIQPVCAELGGLMMRFDHYGPRLDAARRRVDAGETDWFTRPLIDSYHTVWFELHEDLLVTLGIERAREAM